MISETELILIIKMVSILLGATLIIVAALLVFGKIYNYFVGKGVDKLEELETEKYQGKNITSFPPEIEEMESNITKLLKKIETKLNKRA